MSYPDHNKHSASSSTEDFPDWLVEILAGHDVVIFVSSLTDIREAEAALKAAGQGYHVEQMGMGDAIQRQRFGELRDYTKWDHLPMIFVDGHFAGGERELRSHSRIAKMPTIALWLGLTGLIPFILGAVGSLFGASVIGQYAVSALVFYAAVIVSFMAGTQWGGTVVECGSRKTPRYMLSVIPPLFAWSCLLLPQLIALPVLIATFIVVYAIDVAWVLYGWFPRWYLKLRSLLTAVVLLCLALTWWTLFTS